MKNSITSAEISDLLAAMDASRPTYLAAALALDGHDAAHVYVTGIVLAAAAARRLKMPSAVALATMENLLVMTEDIDVSPEAVAEFKRDLSEKEN